MGANCRIYLRTSDGRPPEIDSGWPQDVYLRLNDHEDGPQLAKFYIETPWRYWAPEYTNGPWPQIAALLMLLFSAPNTEAVWYGSDYDEEVPQFSRAELLDFTAEYIGEDL